MNDTVVRLLDVSKKFRIGETHDSLRDLVGSGISRLWDRLSSRSKEGRSDAKPVGARFQSPTAAADRLESRSHRNRSHRNRSQDKWFWALRDVSLTVGRGEAVGIIGPNGAGKSTVLRLLAGILRPSSGEVHVDGRLAALIEVGAGFHGDLTGRENIFLNGAILGMTREEIRRNLDAIVEFAGIARFIDMPVKRYSSGMYARLGFSIAAHVDPDVLLVDEVLSVGDAVFRLRCLERMHELVRNGTTLVFVTHNLDQMQAICSRALVLEGGRCLFDGASRAAVSHYLGAMSRAYAQRPTDVTATDTSEEPAVHLTSLTVLNETGEEVVWIRPWERIRARLTFRLNRAASRLIVELNLRASAHENVLCFNSGRDGLSIDGHIGVYSLTLTIPQLHLSGGQYFWNVRIWDSESGETLLDSPHQCPLVIDDQGRATGILALDHEWAFDAPPGHKIDGNIGATSAMAGGTCLTEPAELAAGGDCGST